jgi:hypothetical protein
MVNNQWSCFSKLFCVSELGNTKFQLPENIVLPLSETALPHVYVGEEACRLTAYITKRTAENQAEGKQYLITDCRVHGELQKVI